jgi:hypothetical protein
MTAAMIERFISPLTVLDVLLSGVAR